MLRPISIFAYAAAFLGFLCITGTASTQEERITLLAATPSQSSSARTYGASLYMIGEQGSVRRIRKLLTPTDGLADVANDLQGHLFLGSANRVSVIDGRNPEQSEVVSLKQFDTFPCWGAIESGGDSGIDYCVAGNINRVRLISNTISSGPGEWADFQNLRYGGQIGGPFQTQSPIAEVRDDGNVVMPSIKKSAVTLATLPQSLHSRDTSSIVVVVASSRKYLVLWVIPAKMTGHTIDGNNPDHVDEIQVGVFDRKAGKWSAFTLPTVVSSLIQPCVRLSGNWLITTEMTWVQGSHENAGLTSTSRGERVALPGTVLPNIPAEYRNNFRDISIPGTLQFRNLQDGRLLELHTGAEDTEVLSAESDSSILYRVDDSIFAAQVQGSVISKPSLVAKDVSLYDVHWALRATSADDQAPEAQKTRKAE